MKSKKSSAIMLTAMAMILAFAMSISSAANGKRDNADSLHGKPFVSLQEQITDLQDRLEDLEAETGEVDLAQLIIGVWDTKSYNNGYDGETGRITFFDDNSFEIEGTLSIIVGCSQGGCDGTGTFQIFDRIIQLKLDGIDPFSGREYTSGYGFPLMVRKNYISLTRFGNQAVLKRSVDN